jgi:superfamily II DNA or RNA helicase
MAMLDAVLAVEDPKRFFSRAFKEKRWDGLVRLNDGRRFPAGLTDRVVECLNDQDVDVSVVDMAETKALDLSRIDAEFLGGVGPNQDQDLWDHQVEAALALLALPRGTVKLPTGSGKTELMALMARFLWEERGWRTLIVLPRKGLARQTVERFNRLYDGDIEVGQCGDGKREVGTVTVGTAQTLIKFMPSQRRSRKTKRTVMIPPDPVLRKMIRDYEVLILDESHHASSESWYTISMQSGALRRYGLSGTPIQHKELADLRMIGATGDIAYSVAPTKLITLGISAAPKICIIASENASGPALPTKTEWRTIEGRYQAVQRPLAYPDAYRLGVVENEYHNESVMRAVAWFVDNGKRTLMLCRSKAHWGLLNMLLDDAGVEYLAVWGDTDTDERERAKKLLNKGKIKVVLATTIFDEGEDVPGIDAMVLAEGVKAHTNAIQRIGRGMRAKKGVNEVWVADFAPTCHGKLVDHATDRAGAYASEGYDVRVLEEWPKSGEEADGELLPFKDWDLTLPEG